MNTNSVTTKCTIDLSLSDGGFMSINIYIPTALYINPKVAKVLYNKIEEHKDRPTFAPWPRDLQKKVDLMTSKPCVV